MSVEPERFFTERAVNCFSKFRGNKVGFCGWYFHNGKAGQLNPLSLPNQLEHGYD
jgi:hypothetical protein